MKLFWSCTTELIVLEGRPLRVVRVEKKRVCADAVCENRKQKQRNSNDEKARDDLGKNDWPNARQKAAEARNLIKIVGSKLRKYSWIISIK
ncbi:MAG: hypothetical protein DI538_24385 [Azospira oryzae]|nr:MAG: hypothetical protein DI538_24385 [Azospira oryzae]